MNAIPALIDAMTDAAALAAYPRTVDLVSLTLDVTSPSPRKGGLTYETEIDRQTRTLLFMTARGLYEGETQLTATALFRLQAEET